MKTLPRLLTLKIIAVVLFILCFSTFIAFGTGAFYAVNCGYFEYPEADSYISSAHLDSYASSRLEQLKAQLQNGDNDLTGYEDENLVFTVLENGKEKLSSSDQAANDRVVASVSLDESTVITARLKVTPTLKDRAYYDFYLYGFVYNMRYAFCIVTVSCFAVSVFLGYFIMCGAGRKRKSDGLFLNMSDRVPFDLYLLALLAGIAASLGFAYKLSVDLALWTIFPIVPCLLIASALVVALLSTVAKHVKNGTWWTKTLIAKGFGVLKNLFLRISNDIEKIFVGLPLVWRSLIISLGYLILTFVALNSKNRPITVMWLVVSVVGIIIICLYVLSAEKLRKGARKIAKGDLNYRIDTDGMVKDFKDHANDLNSISDVLSKAVDERTKSEKFKAELITNVSHDIKTPITSIINYVDLLGRDGVSDEQKKQYLDVLKRQTTRLKKLTVDLVEASKASTGNIQADCLPLNICEMLKQSTGEFAERIEEAGLKLELALPSDAVSVLADGRLLWRVFENLLSNICKYALEGTRVYVNLKTDDSAATVEFKNISREKLNVEANELTERFVRGDSSRSTEGSGLGLSIAKSFTELQNGSFTVTVDGDLFKVEIKLPMKK